LSERAEQALAQARDEARRLGHDAIGAEHILLPLLHPGGAGVPMLRRLGLEADQVRARLEVSGRRGRPRRRGEELAYTSHARRLIEAASQDAREAGVELSAEHLLLAALREPRGVMARILADHGISPSDVGPAEQPVAGVAPTAGLPPHRRKPSTSRWRLVLLAAVPVSIVLGYVLHAPAVWIFITACLGVLPLAGYMGEATEHLAHRTGPTVGGLTSFFRVDDASLNENTGYAPPISTSARSFGLSASFACASVAMDSASQILVSSTSRPSSHAAWFAAPARQNDRALARSAGGVMRLYA
jgi:hypothetical protein